MNRLSRLLLRVPFFRGATSCLMALLLLGCGRPATEEQCGEILRTAARHELNAQIGDNPELVQKELDQIEKALHERMMKSCVGKRIREDALACVRSAKSSEEIIQSCLR
jgi:hypothetical protein